MSLFSGDTSALSQQSQQLQRTCWIGPTDLATDVCLATFVALEMSLGVAESVIFVWSWRYFAINTTASGNLKERKGN